MATSNNSTVPVINPFTGKPIIQRFLDDPELFALVCKEGGADMTEDELADMDAVVENRMREERLNGRRVGSRSIALLRGNCSEKINGCSDRQPRRVRGFLLASF